MIFDRLADRSLVRVSGSDAEHLLENLVTCKVVEMVPGEMRFGALLSPQGKILFDFFLFLQDGDYVFDIGSKEAADFAKRMTFFKLRADATIGAPEATLVTVVWDTQEAVGTNWLRDPRHSELGYRIYGDVQLEGQQGVYEAQRIALCMPQSGSDFELGGAYPHETLMDQFGGVDFRKGCFVGQEVVSRMQHRGNTKKRFVKIASETELPLKTTDIVADGKPAGTLGTRLANHGLALVRLDRVAGAKEIEIEGMPLAVSLPDWVDFSWPERD